MLLPDPRVGRFESAGPGWVYPDAAPAFAAIGSLPSALEEHCQECASPACYEMCPHHLPHGEVGCRRFVGGIRTLDAGDVGLQIAILARIKAKAWLPDSQPVWTRGFFLQIWISLGGPAEPVDGVLQLGRTPWRAEDASYSRSFIAVDGWTELFVSPHDLAMLNGAPRVEASVFFPKYTGHISVRHANFCDSVRHVVGYTQSAMLKVLFCDLDGTVWRGTVGESPVDRIPRAAEALRLLIAKRIQIVALTRATESDARAELAAQHIDSLFTDLISVRRDETKPRHIAKWLHEHGFGPR